MSYMSVNKTELEKDLRLAIAEIAYVNDDGDGRKALITLMKHYIPEYDRHRIDEIVKQEARPDVIKVWDVPNHAWRLIPLSQVRYCQMKDGW
jgi:uncharacterized Fe-S radical SAM superfamily protein PflX